MYHTIRVIVVFFLVTSTGLVLAKEQKDNFPTIHIVNPAYDFGEVPRGEVLRHQFIVHNRGTAPLEIRKIEPD